MYTHINPCTHLICVLYPKYKFALMGSSKQEVIQRCPQATKMQLSCRAWSKTHSDSITVTTATKMQQSMQAQAFSEYHFSTGINTNRCLFHYKTWDFYRQNDISVCLMVFQIKSKFYRLREHFCTAALHWVSFTNRLAKPGGRFKNTYELLNLRALKISKLHKNHIFQCMGKIFCVEFQRVPLKFHTKYLTHTLKDVYFINIWKFKSSLI